MIKDSKNLKPLGSPKPRDSIFSSLFPSARESPKKGLSLTAETFLELPQSSHFPLTPKSPITHSKVSQIMTTTAPSLFKKSPTTEPSQTLSITKREMLKETDRKNPQIHKLFHVEKPDILKDHKVADHHFRQEINNPNVKKYDNEEIGDVRKLDEWQMMFKRTQGMGMFMKNNDPNEQNRREIVEKQDFPNVRQDIINRIIGDSDEEEGGRKGLRESLPSLKAGGRGFMGDSGDHSKEELKAAGRSLEVMQRENNKDLLVERINKKVKEFIQTIDVTKMNEEQLRVHVKKVAEGVIAQFKTFQDPSGSFIVYNCVESTVKALKSKNLSIESFLGSPKERTKQEGVPKDYEMMEDLMMEKFVICQDNEDVLRARIRELNLDSYNLQKEIMNYNHEIEAVHQRFGTLLGDEELSDISQSNVVRTAAARRYGMSLMEAQALRVEKHLELKRLSKSIQITKDRLARKAQDIQLKENELENNNVQKDYLKTQLRELYFKCLKDETALLNHRKNPLSYAWVLRSLWRIHEEVKEHAFPSFLDSTSIKFIVDYAKAQDEFEEFCKKNNLPNLFSQIEDFKSISKTLDFATFSPSHGNRPNTEHLNAQKMRIRDLGMMMEDMRAQIADVKRVNLKARRQVYAGRYSMGSKAPIYKWEDVDPRGFDSHSSPTTKLNDIGSVISMDGFNPKISDQAKMKWEQGQEKIRLMQAARKKEIDRLFNQNLARDVDDRLKGHLKKAFNFLFGKIGPETYSRFIREKNGYDQNAQGKAKKAANMSHSGHVFSSPSSPASANSKNSPLLSKFLEPDSCTPKSVRQHTSSQFFQQSFTNIKTARTEFEEKRTPSLGECKTILLPVPMSKKNRLLESSVGRF